MIEKLFGNYKLLQSDRFFKLTTDSVFLSAALEIAPCETAIELGTGAGALWVLAAAKNPNCRIDGIEILPDACKLALENQVLNHMQARGEIICMDVCQVPKNHLAKSYDVCFSNPPYFDRNCGNRAQNDARESARGGASYHANCVASCNEAPSNSCSHNKTSAVGSSCRSSFADFCAAASFLLKPDGRFYFCYRPNCIAQIARDLNAHGFSLQKTTHVYAKKCIFDLFFAQKCTSNFAGCVENIHLFTTSGHPSAEYRKAYMLDL